MGFSALADMSQRLPHNGRQTPRNSPISGFTIHYQAGVDAHGESQNPSREVSAQYWIKNDGTILPNIDENMRAWTTGANGYPAGAASDHRNITAEVSCMPGAGSAISEAAWTSLIRLIADCAKRHGFPVVRSKTRGIAVHQDFVPTECPGAHIMNNMNDIIAQAAGASVNPSPAPAPTPAPIGKSVAALADEVMAGKHGNGDARRASLGAMFDAVQAEVNRRLYGQSAPAVVTNIEALAHAVLRGEYGNGDDRVRRLGNNYGAVQARVNQILAGQAPAAPAGPDINALAHAVLRGEYGNGVDRQSRLGGNYAAVQARVNQLLGL